MAGQPPNRFHVGAWTDSILGGLTSTASPGGTSERAQLQASIPGAARKRVHFSVLHTLAQAEGEALPEPEEAAHESVVKLPGSSGGGSEGGSDESGGGGDDAFALRNIDFNVKAGELLCVTGRVGSGKSSLVRTTALSSGSHASAAGSPYRGTYPEGTSGKHGRMVHVELSACCHRWCTEEAPACV